LSFGALIEIERRWDAIRIKGFRARGRRWDIIRVRAPSTRLGRWDTTIGGRARISRREVVATTARSKWIAEGLRGEGIAGRGRNEEHWFPIARCRSM
jgi:hypothetical protein